MQGVVLVEIQMTVLEIKAAVRARDGLKCIECGMTAEQHIERYGVTLDVHRLVPGSKYAIDGCVTLCKKCHGPKEKIPSVVGGSCGYVVCRIPSRYLEPLERAAAAHFRGSRTKEAIAAIDHWLRMHDAHPDGKPVE